jgi:hypothetical protein
MSFLRHSLHTSIQARREVESRERARRDFVHEHRNRRAKVSKLMLIADEIAVTGEQKLNPYRDAAAMADFLDAFTATERQAFAALGGFDHVSDESWEMLVEGYRERAQLPHCAGLRDMSLARLQAFGGELQTLVDSASDSERQASWWTYARTTEREVHFEIALRAQKQAS